MSRDLLRGHLAKYNHVQRQFFQPQSLFVSDPQQLDQVVKVVMPNKNLKAAYQQGLLKSLKRNSLRHQFAVDLCCNSGHCLRLYQSAENETSPAEENLFQNLSNDSMNQTISG